MEHRETPVNTPAPEAGDVRGRQLSLSTTGYLLDHFNRDPTFCRCEKKW
nr:MAG TPA: hypothetical protein [Caudoviricetes sp.]